MLTDRQSRSADRRVVAAERGVARAVSGPRGSHAGDCSTLATLTGRRLPSNQQRLVEARAGRITPGVDVADLNIGNYHGAFSYNFGSESTPVRPYLFGGAGATTYGSLAFVGRDGQPREIGGRARLSPTFGGGVKIYRGPVGARLEARMTPTYIKSNDAGWWCDPYWGCYVVQDVQYSSQFQLSGGVTFRF